MLAKYIYGGHEIFCSNMALNIIIFLLGQISFDITTMHIPFLVTTRNGDVIIITVELI